MAKDLTILGHFQIRQDTETPLTALSTPLGTLLYLYARSGDSVSSATIGQDYLTFRFGESNLVFAVCDGVGQSFMGNLAACMLGDGLVEWLWGIRRPADAGNFSKAVTEALNALTSTSAPRVAEYKLPDNLPPILVQALEMQRRYGSESMFVAGRLSLGGKDPWVALCWLGDSPVAAIDMDGRLVDLGPRGHTSERWNATTGVKGTVHAWVGSAEKVARVAGYTDGLGLTHVPTDPDLARLMEEWKTSPPADDASLFDVRLAPSPQTRGLPEISEADLLKHPVFQADPTRPIPLPAETPATAKETPIPAADGERGPVAGVSPIPPATGGSVVEGWRPLSPQGRPQAEGVEGGLTGLSTQQQIRVWQQAALLGLTSAALAMMMLERLIKEQESK
jgi:hypothetical protein